MTLRLTSARGPSATLLDRYGIEPRDADGLGGIVAGYLLTRGFFSRRPLDFALAAVVALVWGGALLSGLLPEAGISWQAHLFGGVGGVVAGRALASPKSGAAQSGSAA